MPVPLTADANVLGRLAVKTSPRLAAMLMASHHSGMPLMATPHLAGASPAASVVLSPSNPLARWGEKAEGAVTAARAKRAAAPGQPHLCLIQASAWRGQFRLASARHGRTGRGSPAG